jgi:hypothetical protein
MKGSMFQSVLERESALSLTLSNYKIFFKEDLISEGSTYIVTIWSYYFIDCTKLSSTQYTS